MDVTREIVERLAELPPDRQDQVLRFVVALADSGRTGEDGKRLLPFAATLDHKSANEMSAAIEAECGRVDAGGW